MTFARTERLHASAVAIDGRAALILGASGSGKSSLCLDLMAFGATLVGDDQVRVEAEGPLLLVRPEPALAGLIEARGVGILRADHLESAEVYLVVDLDSRVSDRVPLPQTRQVLGVALPCLGRPQNSSFPSAILQYLRMGRAEV